MELHTDYDKMFENIVTAGTEYLQKYPNIKSMIVGVSGGIDSAVTAAIAREICDRNRKFKSRDSKYKLIGVSIPIESNKQSEINCARAVGNAFCHEFNEVKFIHTIFRLFKLFIEVFITSKYHSERLEERIRYGNIKARLRMIYLYDKAHRNDGIVLSTDNLSELLLGFWTLHGDVGDLGFIQSLWKTEVYGLADYLCLKYSFAHANERAIALRAATNAIPTDGLGVTTSDFDQLGVSNYGEVDGILIDYINGADIKVHPIIQRHLRSQYKRENPYNVPRERII